MAAFIDAVHAREILDSRGNPTVEVEVPVSYTHLTLPTILLV